MSLGSSPGSPGSLGIAFCYYENSDLIMAPGSKMVYHPWSRSFERKVLIFIRRGLYGIISVTCLSTTFSIAADTTERTEIF
jgi:hypothetical protein